MTTKYEIHLDGVHASDLSLGVLRDLADLVVEGSSRAARLAAEGRSTARGTAPLWLGDASDVRLVGLREGSLLLDVTARPLADLAPNIFAVTTDSLVPQGETAFDLLMNAVDDALNGRRDSDRLDLGMLQTLVKAKSIFARGATQLRISQSGGRTIEFTENEVATFQKLATETPSPKVDRIVGVLDALTMSTRTLILKLGDGAALKGNVAASLDLGTVKELLGMEVVVEGTVAFRPSSRPQRIELEHIALASTRDVLWRGSPRGERQQLALPVEDLSSFLGQWPGDEDDEQVFAALKELA